MADEECCCVCHFASGPITAPKHNHGAYYCRRFPPREHSDAWDSTYPICRPHHWCGEYKAGTPAPITPEIV